MKVGTRLAILRIVRGWTQDELARRAGIRSGTVSDYERGKMVPGLLALQHLLDAMGYRLSDLETVGDVWGSSGKCRPLPTRETCRHRSRKPPPASASTSGELHGLPWFSWERSGE